MDSVVVTALSGLSAVAVAAHRISSNSESKSKEEGTEEERKKLKALQWKFLGAYFCALMGEQ